VSFDAELQLAKPVPGPSVARRVKGLTKDSLVYGVGMAGQKMIGLILLPVLTRVFQPAEYGASELIGLLLLMASYFVVLGNDAALLRFTYDTDSDLERRRIASLGLLFRVVVAILLTFLCLPAGRFLSQVIFNSPDFEKFIVVTMADLPFATVVKFCIDLLRVRLRPAQFVAYSLGNLAAIAVLTLALTPSVLQVELPLTGSIVSLHGHGMGLMGVFVARLVADVIFTAIGLIWTWKDFGRPVSLAVLGGMLRYGLPLVPVGLAQFVLAYADRYVLNKYVSLDQVGPYSVGAKVASFMMLFVAAFQYAWGPFAISIFREANARETYAKVFLLYAFVAGAIGLLLTGLAREFLALITTSHFAHGYRIAGFLVFAAIAQGAFFIPATGLQIAKRTGWMGTTAVLAAVLNVVLNLVLVRPFEAFGVAAASLVSQVAATIFLFVVAQRIYPVPFHPGRVLLTFVMAIGLAALGIYFGRTGTGAAVLATACSLGLYFAGTLGLKVITVQDFVIIRNYLQKKAAAAR
jgi:O-antigen/teichoic acid export membrane protein